MRFLRPNEMRMIAKEIMTKRNNNLYIPMASNQDRFL